MWSLASSLPSVYHMTREHKQRAMCFFAADNIDDCKIELAMIIKYDGEYMWNRTPFIKSLHKQPNIWYHVNCNGRLDCGVELATSLQNGGDWHWGMMTSSNGNIFRVTCRLCGEYTDHRWIPRKKASDKAIWCFLGSAAELNKRLNKRMWGWWFETPSRPLWRQCNVTQ